MTTITPSIPLLYYLYDKCLSNPDLLGVIFTYLSPIDLFRSTELVCHLWYQISERQYKLWFDCHDELKYLVRSIPKKWNTPKRISAYYVRRRQKGQFFLFGGSFGSKVTTALLLEDYPVKCLLSEAEGWRKRSFGCFATVLNPFTEELYVIGGWCDRRNSSTCRMYRASTNQHNFEDFLQVKASRDLKDDLPSPLCYQSACMTSQGDLLVTGGSDAPYRGAEVSAECLFRSRRFNGLGSDDTIDESVNSYWATDVLPPLSRPRCGHVSFCLNNYSSVSTDSIVVVGGYHGGYDYSDNAEMFDWERQQWYNLPQMSIARSGPAGVVGPNGSIYIAGGSLDGTIAHQTMERYDFREGKWEMLPAQMHLPRGYISGSVGVGSGLLYVCGGLEDLTFQGGIECYDFRAARWIGLTDSCDDLLLSPSMRNLPVEYQTSNQYYSGKFFHYNLDAYGHYESGSLNLARASYALIYIG